MKVEQDDAMLPGNGFSPPASARDRADVWGRVRSRNDRSISIDLLDLTSSQMYKQGYISSICSLLMSTYLLMLCAEPYGRFYSSNLFFHSSSLT